RARLPSRAVTCHLSVGTLGWAGLVGEECKQLACLFSSYHQRRSLRRGRCLKGLTGRLLNEDSENPLFLCNFGS
ncbi:hypothetical protein ILYODFUR_012244, partial [Ilyodon furcidens]